MPDAEVEAVQTRTLPAGTERILLVEDNEDLLEATSSMLITFGYQVSCARTGAEAIAILDSGEEFELLFTDVVMPNGMNGIELARQARQRNKDMKVLLTSGYAGDVLERYRAVDEFPIIDKPFRLSDSRGGCGRSCRQRNPTYPEHSGIAANRDRLPRNRPLPRGLHMNRI